MAAVDLLTDIFLACRAQLARVVSRIVPPQDIEDVVQETYVKVCQYAGRSEVAQPRALMLSVARHLALNHIKRAEYRLTTRYESDEDLDTWLAQQASDTSFSTIASREEFARFCDAVRRLPRQCRRVFVLKKVYGYSQREIAVELGVSENTVEKHIASGMQHCSQYLDEAAPEMHGTATGRRRLAPSTRGRS